MANFSLFASRFLGQNSTFCSSAPWVDVLDIDSVSLINSIFMLSKPIFLLYHSLELVISYVSIQPQSLCGLKKLYLRPNHGLTSAVEFLISWQPGLPSFLLSQCSVQRGAWRAQLCPSIHCLYSHIEVLFKQKHEVGTGEMAQEEVPATKPDVSLGPSW